MAKHNTSYCELLMHSPYGFYFMGLIDPSQVAPMVVNPLDDPCFKLLVPGPGYLPTSFLTDPQFQHGAISGYYCGGVDEQLEGYGFAPARVVNWVYSVFRDEVCNGCDRAWLVGYILGELSALAEYDRMLALTGIAHCSFLLSLVPSLPQFQLACALTDASHYHRLVVGAYRERVQAIKNVKGWDVWTASRAALVNDRYADMPYADGSLSLADEEEVAS